MIRDPSPKRGSIRPRFFYPIHSIDCALQLVAGHVDDSNHFDVFARNYVYDNEWQSPDNQFMGAFNSPTAPRSREDAKLSGCINNSLHHPFCGCRAIIGDMGTDRGNVGESRGLEFDEYQMSR